MMANQSMNANFKTFQSFANRSSNTLPILDYVKIENGTATISDLETHVQFDAPLKDGYYSIRMNEPFWIRELDDNYPVLPSEKVTTASAVVTASLLLKFAPLTANDELRPVMNGIFMNASHIVASDAHVLRYQTGFANRIDESFEAIIPIVAPLLTRCKTNPSELITIESFLTANDYQQLRFTFSDCTIITRATEGKYPNFMAVIPTNQDQKCFSLSVSTIQEMTKTAKAFKNDTVVISDIGMVISNPDFKLEKQWNTPAIVPMPSRFPDGVIMPKMVEELVPESADNYRLGLDPNKLAQFITMFKGNIIIGFTEVSRAFCVWFESTDRPAVSEKKVTSHAPAPVKQKAVDVYQPHPVKVKAIEAHVVTVAPVAQQLKEIVAPNHIPVPPQAKQQNIAEFVIVNYSERSVALFGDTWPIKEKLMELHGVFNRRLKYNDQPASGWVFSLKREAALRQLIAS